MHCSRISSNADSFIDRKLNSEKTKALGVMDMMSIVVKLRHDVIHVWLSMASILLNTLTVDNMAVCVMVATASGKCGLHVGEVRGYHEVWREGQAVYVEISTLLRLPLLMRLGSSTHGFSSVPKRQGVPTATI